MNQNINVVIICILCLMIYFLVYYTYPDRLDTIVFLAGFSSSVLAGLFVKMLHNNGIV